MPLTTIDAFRDHDHVRGDTITADLPGARESLDALARVGIDLDKIAGNLQVDGISAFAADYDRVLAALEKKKLSLGNAASIGRLHGHSRVITE